MKTVKTIATLLFWLLICQLPGLPGAAAVRQNLDWYRALNRPPLTPPDAVFGLAWPLLYGLLGIGAFLVFRNLSTKPAQRALLPFWIQLTLNACWTPLFFGLHLPGTALALLAAMVLQALWLAESFWRANRAAGLLLIPYGLWLLYAGYLNAGVWLLNR